MDAIGRKTIAVTRRGQRIWQALLALFIICALASLITWGVLLTAICSGTRHPIPEVQHVIAYNCHGMTVYMSPFQDAMRQWLIPIGGLFVVLSVIAAVMVFFAAAKVRVDVQIHVTDASGGMPPAEGGRG